MNDTHGGILMTKQLTLGVAVALMMAAGRATATSWVPTFPNSELRAALTLQASAPGAAAIDPVAVTLTSPDDVVARRAALIDETWGMTALPATLPTVTPIANPFGSTLPDVGEVFNYRAAMSNGQVNNSNFYLNSSPNGQVVIMNMGHMAVGTWPNNIGTTNWTLFNPVFGTVPMMTALLNAGFSIYAMNMPTSSSQRPGQYHDALFAQFGSAAMQYFLEPAVQAMNYWQAHRMFSQDDFVGLSGGAWTGTLLQALDPRVTTAVLNSGSLPGVQFSVIPPTFSTDAEQNWAPFYTIAGYVDLYLMGANGPGRQQLQVLNERDSCCFGPLQWNSLYMAANGGRSWLEQVNFYESLIDAAPIPSNFSVVIDDTAQSHQFSDPFFVNLTVNTLLSNAVATPEPPTWVMLLPGLGFVGYLRMRRSKRQTA